MFRQRRLLRDGVAVPGYAVGGKTEHTRNGVIYRIEYAYSTTDDGALAAKTTVSKAQYEQHTTDNPHLTVLYNPAKAKDSLPYRVITAATLVE